MARFTPDFVNAQASIPVVEKGRYQLRTTSSKGFVGRNKSDDINSGVRIGMEIVGAYDAKGKLNRDMEGTRISSYTIWTHTKGGWDFAKSAMMAMAGYKREDEATANEKLFSVHEWFVDGEPDSDGEVEIGDGYLQLLDKIVDVNLDKSVSESEDGRVFENQEFSGWSPPAK